MYVYCKIIGHTYRLNNRIWKTSDFKSIKLNSRTAVTLAVETKFVPLNSIRVRQICAGPIILEGNGLTLTSVVFSTTFSLSKAV